MFEKSIESVKNLVIRDYRKEISIGILFGTFIGWSTSYLLYKYFYPSNHACTKCKYKKYRKL